MTHDVDVHLPDLDAGATVDTMAERVRKVAVVFASAMLEEMGLFAVAEKVAEQFASGMLPVGRGAAGERIHRWIEDAPDRISEDERREVYARVLGQGRGAATGARPNRDFENLWRRFLSSVGELRRQDHAPALGRETPSVSQEQAREAGRQLAANLSVRGDEPTRRAAIALRHLLRETCELLAEPDLLAAYDARDVWALVDRVSATHLGGPVNRARYREMAWAGADVLSWLAGSASHIADAKQPEDARDCTDRRPGPSSRLIPTAYERCIRVDRELSTVVHGSLRTVWCLGQCAHPRRRWQVGRVARQARCAMSLTDCATAGEVTTARRPAASRRGMASEPGRTLLICRVERLLAVPHARATGPGRPPGSRPDRVIGAVPRLRPRARSALRGHAADPT